MKKWLGIIKNEQGITLIMVVLLFSVILILGTSILGLTMNNAKMSSTDRTYQSAYYIAESGITYTMDEINNNLVNIYNNSSDKNTYFSSVNNFIMNLNNQPSYKNFEKYYGTDPEAKISIQLVTGNNTEPADYRDYKIVSKGMIGSESRTVEKPIRILWIQKSSITLPPTALFVAKTIDLSGGATITGEAGTNASSAGSIKLDGGANISGTIYVGPNAQDNAISKPSWMNLNNQIVKLSETKKFDLPPFPEFPNNPLASNTMVNNYNVINNGKLYVNDWRADGFTLNMDRDMQFDEIFVDRGFSLNINIGNNSRSIVVNKLNVKNGKINIIGNGKLTIYVKKDISMGDGSVINPIDSSNNTQLVKNQINKLDIYYQGSNLTLSGAQKIYGSLYAQKADITMDGGSGFQGAIITGGSKITIGGGANAVIQLFYAPNAIVNMLSGGTLKGSIIAQAFIGSGGSRLILNNGDSTDLPPIFGGTSNGNITSAKSLISAGPTREK